MATGARGEAVVECGGRSYPVLFTNRALAEAEKALGKPALQIGYDAQRGQVSVGDTAELLRIGLEYGRRDAPWSHEPVRSPLAYEILDALGFQSAAVIVLNCLQEVLSYDPQAEGRENPPA